MLERRLNSSVPLLRNVNDTDGLTSAMRSNAVRILFNSVVFDFRNLRLAGTLKNKLLMRKLLPTGQEQAS